MKIIFIDQKSKHIEADVEIIFVVKKELEHRFVKDADVLKKLKFKGEDEQVAYLHDKNKIYVGVETEETDSFRIAASVAIRKIKTLEAIKTIKLGLYGTNIPTFVAAICDGFILGNYEFKRYKSKNENISIDFEISFYASSYHKDASIDAKEIEKAIHTATIISKAVNFTRDIVNTPPNHLYPEVMAHLAKEVAKDNHFECKIYDDEYLKEKGMGAMLAVSLASIHRPRLVHMIYTPKKPKAKIVLVGKGLTYDSGGLSLKPSDFMVTMKADKSGASAVIGMMKAVSELQLDIEVHGICGIVENMIGGDAYKPDDVLKAKNGTTIEVRNTDAEGRLVLADCLCYAQDEIEEFDYIFDFATLTGACVVAVGEYTTGIMGHSNKLKHTIFEAASASGELVGALPFNRYLPKLLKSEIADICNISSSRYGGAITAALFLDKFIKDENKDKWMHFDIAGPAYVEKAWGYNPHGASGAGVRLALSFLQRL